ncbi:TetR/AcrR family transcriptional regulator [Streptomyces armeniacus]|uniref:TetR/AcrR family transcriptional regulator n=1 Tax=Streptomyces armeniacus TaxID=83291 RepID=A0A345XIQ7_9ACTN|nr:TetR/AcrR family transcriptional regulator [Streptomyces armeniacus]AXK31523.1 TetR/AcrR family transcriptional regulator [Streptomyces armeniacus]
MPSARETLLEAAHAAVSARPWAGVRMVEIAASAGVSRQTLYNEFGSKEGLGSALVSQRVTDFLDSAAAVAAQSARKGADPAASCAAAAAWMLRTAPGEPLVRAALTGCWGRRMPLPAQERPAEPGELAAELRDRLVAGFAAQGGGGGSAGSGAAHDAATLSRACEAGLRLTLSYLVAPVKGPEEELGVRVDEVVRALLD